MKHLTPALHLIVLLGAVAGAGCGQDAGAQSQTPAAVPARTPPAPVARNPHNAARPALIPDTIKAGETQTFVGIEFVRVPPGSFTMGGLKANFRMPHPVTITHGYWMGKYEVTQAQWEAVMGSNPSHWKGDPRRPVEQVSWRDVHKFIAKLNELNSGMDFRLPTEAEWEYACRAGSQAEYFFGDDAGMLKDYAVYYENSGYKTNPVGQKKPNAWGIYDMAGNVLEVVEDRWGLFSADPQVDPKGPATGADRVRRGGAWYYAADFLVSEARRSVQEDYSNNAQGLRLAR